MEEFPIQEYWTIIKRRRKTFAVVFGAVLALAFLVALNWSNYRSTATVEVEQAEISTDITIPVGMNRSDMMEAMADQRISRIQQKVISTGSLVEIITKFNLYPAQRARKPIALIAEDMRKKIKLQLVSSMLANPASAQKATAGQLAAIAFTLSFDYSEPLLAQQVTNELVSQFLDEDLKQRRAMAEETSAFLGKQIEMLEKALVEQEKQIAEYRQQSGDTRPEALMFNQQASAQVAMSLQTVDSQIATTEGNISALRAQLLAVDPYSRAFADGQVLTSPAMQLKALQTKYATLTAQYGPEHPDVIKTRRQMDALKSTVQLPVDTAMLEAKLDEAKTKLAQAEKTYGPENPDVASLKRQVEKLQKQKDAATKDGMPSDSLIKTDADNPTYLSIVSQLREAEGRLKGLQAQRGSLIAQQEKYRQAVIGNPVAEQQLAALTRDYDNAQMRYRELKVKKMSADMSEQMEKDRKGQRMTVINPPELPLSTKPSRMLLLLGGAVLAFGAGLGAVIAQQLISQSLCGPLHLAGLVGVAPLACIPYLSTQAERYRADRQKRYAIGAMGLFALLALIVFSLTVMPLDVLWGVVARRVGLS